MSHLPVPDYFRFGDRVYTIGETYSFTDLPRKTQTEILGQEADVVAHYGRDPQDLFYSLILIPHEEAEALLRQRFGNEGFEKFLRDRSIRLLAENIGKNGLRNPPVLDEGIRRILALILLGWDVPYVRIQEPLEIPWGPAIPTLDGRKKKR